MLRRLAFSALLLPVFACSSVEPTTATNAPPGSEPSTSNEPAPSTNGPSSPADPTKCTRAPKTADVARKVVVSHPYGKEAEDKAKLFEVLDLSLDGKLTRTGKTFEMGRAFDTITFTPDGEIGMAVQEDGSIGVFAFDANGDVRVVQSAFTGDFYAHRIVVSKDGTRAFIVDENTANNGGGVHAAKIACDGTLTYEGLVVPGGRAHAMAVVPNDPDRAILVGYKAHDSKDGDYVHRLDLAAPNVPLLASGKAFGDEEAIASWVSVSHDGKYALVTDNGFAKGSRMVAVDLATMTPLPVVATPNPAAVVFSPWDDAALLLNSDGEDALRVVRYDASKSSPFTIGPEVGYAGGKKTSLPTVAAVVERGALKGTVLVLEVTAVRTLTFASGGTITDKGTLDFGEGYESITGALGVQP
jgi:hypothetical protein